MKLPATTPKPSITEDTEPELAVLPMQRATAERFRKLASEAASPLERNRIGYFAGFVGFMVPYCDALRQRTNLMRC